MIRSPSYQTWQTPSLCSLPGSRTRRFELDRGWISTWVKMASGWSCLLLYTWTVLAPALMPERDFSSV